MKEYPEFSFGQVKLEPHIHVQIDRSSKQLPMCKIKGS